MNTTYKNTLIGIVALLVLVGGFFLFKGDGEEGVVLEQSDLETGEILVMGEISCLPYRSATPGQGCVKGILGNDGKMYAINSIAVRNAENAMEEGTDVTAIGTFEPADTSVNDSSVFRYDGVLVIRTLEAK